VKIGPYLPKIWTKCNSLLLPSHPVGLQGAAKKWTLKVFRRFLSNRLGF